MRKQTSIWILVNLNRFNVKNAINGFIDSLWSCTAFKTVKIQFLNVIYAAKIYNLTI